MSFAEKKQQYIEETVRNSIYEAALQVLEEKGADGLTISSVAKTAGMATGTVYNYFKDKVDLIHYIHDKTHNDFMDILRPIVESDISAKEKLRQVLRKIFQFADFNNRTFIVISECRVGRYFNRELRKKSALDMLGLFEKIVVELQKEIWPKHEDTRTLAQMLVGSAIGVIKMQTSLEEFDWEKDSQAVYNLILKNSDNNN